MPSSSIVPLPIHPFPARMAPEIALEQVLGLSSEAVILDPMTGSGTVPRVATDHNRRCFGFDTDPLAVLMAKVWTTPIEVSELRGTAAGVIRRVENMHTGNFTLPWIDEDVPTRRHVDYWFGSQQQAVLRRISRVLFDLTGDVADALKIALSRIIVTKNKGASLARDVSHSRPHRVGLESDFDVIRGFRLSIERLARRLEEQKPKSNAIICRADARDLPNLDGTIDAVITSPPYLNAIDYLRGHKLSLVWLGYKLGELAPIRSNNIGAERAPDASADLDLARQLTSALGSLTQLPQRVQRMINRYVLDLHSMISEVYRVLRVGGKAIFVVGNSCIKGVFVRNDLAVRDIAKRVGLQFEADTTRDLPPSRRYLPPPSDNQEGSNLEKRMRTETVLTYRRV
jgi:DNA modification methylase